jgi:hypothetical protein
MDFADDSVSGYAAKLAGNLTGAETIGPELLELFYALVRPTHPVLPCLDRYG